MVNVSHIRRLFRVCIPGIKLKSVVYAAVASLCLISAPAQAQELLVARMITEVCLPYATRAQSFEKSIRAARDLEFRRPVRDNEPLEEWASEIELISRDGVWRLHLEEGTLEDGDSPVYAAGCTISSRRASVRDLTDLGRSAFGDPERWSYAANDPRRWDRRLPRPDERRLAVEVKEPAEQLPAMTITGYYF